MDPLADPGSQEHDMTGLATVITVVLIAWFACMAFMVSHLMDTSAEAQEELSLTKQMAPSTTKSTTLSIIPVPKGFWTILPANENTPKGAVCISKDMPVDGGVTTLVCVPFNSKVPLDVEVPTSNESEDKETAPNEYITDCEHLPGGCTPS